MDWGEVAKVAMKLVPLIIEWAERIRDGRDEADVIKRIRTLIRKRRVQDAAKTLRSLERQLRED